MYKFFSAKQFAMVITFLIITFSNLILGNGKGSLTGKVIDKTTKQPIQYVNVVVIGTSLGAMTDSSGKYWISAVDENIYQLKYSLIGYSSSIESEIRVINGKSTMVKDIELSESFLNMDSVIVSAGYFSKDNESPVTNFSYSREEIRRSPGAAGDIFRAIETLPGVSSSGGEFSAFSVRGGSPRDNIVLIDNIPFDKFSHFDNGGSEEQVAQGGRFSIFAPGLIDEANFQAGGFSAKYGGKNASFVDLKIKEGNKESMTANGSYDLLGWEVNYDGPLYGLGKTSSLISLRHQDFSKVLEITDQKDMGTPSFTDIIVKTTTDLSPKHKLSLLGIYSPESVTRTIENVLEAKDDNYQPYIAKTEETKYLLGMKWRYLSGLSSFMENTFYYKRTENDQKTGRVYLDFINGVKPTKENTVIKPDYFKLKDSDYQLGWKSEFTFNPFQNTTVQLGSEVFGTNYNYSRTQNGLDTLYTFDGNDYRPDPSQYYLVLRPEETSSQLNGNKISANAYVDAKYDMTNQLVIMPGVRYEYNGFNKNSYLSPRVSLSYQLTERTKLHAATGVYYQTPELRVIAMKSENALLKNERAYHVIFGVTTYLSDDLKFTTEVYRKDFSDLVTRPDRTLLTYNNAGSGYAQGIDFGLIKKFSNQWYGQLNYSYSASKRNDNDGRGEYNSDFSQPNIFNVLVGYELNKEWSFSTKWKYSTGRPKDSYIVHENIYNNPNYVRYSREITGNNDERLNDFQSLNIRVDYRHQFGALALVAFLDVLNVYNRLNVSDEQFIEFTGKIKEGGFKMIPTFGFKLEF
ncbi:MAG: TonB-dependent receptor [Ignavibacteriaceae bacterium]|jgi:outer membrane receptor for ferrienterochelin and colicin